MFNIDIRETAKKANVKLWRVAEAMGTSDSGLSRKLRHELPEEEKNKIHAIIKELAKK
mgnify:CR=1 FL=1